MKVHVITAFGGTTVFRIVDIAIPKIRRGHVLIKVNASSLNPLDVRIRTGGPPWSPALPGILHGDVSGIVTEVGAGVDNLHVGDEVYGYIGGIKGYPGAVAEYALADSRLLALKPKTLTFVQAAVLPLVSITAWIALFERARIKSGTDVLIHAGAGGVGHIAIQLARNAGARIFTTISSPEKANIAKRFGAHVAINHHTMQVDDYLRQFHAGKGFDFVFDTVGGPNLTNSFQAAETNGTVVTINSRGQIDLTPFHSKGLTLHIIFMLIPLLQNKGLKQYGDILSKVAQLADAGKLRPHINKKSFGFSELPAAHQYWESGQALGKISLVQDF